MKLNRIFRLAGTAIAASNKKDGNVFKRFVAFLRMLRHTLAGRYNPKKRNMFLGALVIFYVISPIDLLPGIFIDDLALVLFAMKFFGKELERFLDWEKIRKLDTSSYTDAEIVD